MNHHLKTLYEEDQKDRENFDEWGKSIPLKDVKKRDSKRLAEALNAIKKKELKDGIDYYHASMILQHSNNPKHFKLANELCSKAIKLREEKAKWLYAATLDRYLMNTGSKYQKYGTQYKREKNGPWKLYPVDPKTTDKMRAKYNVRSLAEAQEYENILNANI